ncbi:hypothetical protein F442_02780 [Phytophthora nicotianae P10297]|uniref:Tc1-like transposase DDE domain-containing protein n=1 Tax=Phytophthora nicotianae P10297 TaxID=1317064 RepID=W3A0W3_PHYNI|nr:hypothetical protein F442_02780 [Phytophthora nicotianae P10297]
MPPEARVLLEDEIKGASRRRSVKASQEFRSFFQGKKIVVVLDNAPAHRQTDDCVTKHENMELLRLGPYSPMCNPTEGCFSVLKANIKRHLPIYREEICDRSRQLEENGDVITLAERQMRVLKRATKAEIKCMTSVLVSRMELHCSKAVNAAAEGIPMVYGK